MEIYIAAYQSKAFDVLKTTFEVLRAAMGQFDVSQGKLCSDQLCASIGSLVCPSAAKLLLVGGRKPYLIQIIFTSENERQNASAKI